MMWVDLGIIIGTTLTYASPLIFAALGGVISERAGVINIGIEGMLSIGAFFAAMTAYFTQDPWLGLLIGGLAGLCIALLHAILSVSLGANQVISGFAIYFLGPSLALFLSRVIFQSVNTPPIFGHKLPTVFTHVFPNNSFGDLAFGLHITVYLAIALVVIVWIFLYRTKVGMRLRAVGENPYDAEALGINVIKYRYMAVLVSGFLAGIGGATLSLAISSRFTPTLVDGQGFIALAAVIFGRWNPIGAFIACLIFGLGTALSIFFGQVKIGIPSEILNMFPYIVTIIALVCFKGNSKPPKYDGIPFKRGQTL